MAKKPTLLSSGNPQIAKAYGNEPVQEYIAAMPGWKSDVGRQLDKLIEKAVPKVTKAVKYNQPLYGLDGETWFVAFYCYTKYIQITFFKGAHLDPIPPKESKIKDVRYFSLFEGDALDEKQLIGWFKQAAKLEGTKL